MVADTSMNESAIANVVIDRLNGTHAVAAMCDVRPPTISCWRKRGIPDGWLAFLRVVRPDVFKGLEDFLPKRKYTAAARPRGPRGRGVGKKQAIAEAA
jgi:hypothetical protein